MSTFFKRKYSLSLGAEPIEDLRCSFEIERTLKKQPNKARITLYNLNQSTRSQLALSTDTITMRLEAGYEFKQNLIFTGDLRRVDQKIEKSDWITNLRAGDGEKGIALGRASKSFKKGASVSDTLQYLVKQVTGVDTGNVVEKIKKGDLKGAITQMQSGFVAHGNAYDLLHKYMGFLGYDLSIQDGNLIALGPLEFLDLPVVELNSSTGLINTPEFGEKGFVKATSLLNSDLIPGCQVNLKSESGEGGLYRVEGVTHKGDTHGNDWFSEMTLRSLTAQFKRFQQVAAQANTA